MKHVIVALLLLATPASAGIVVDPWLTCEHFLQMHDRSPKEPDALAARYYAGVANIVSTYEHPLVDPIVSGGPPFAERIVDFCERNRSSSFQQMMANLIRAIVLH